MVDRFRYTCSIVKRWDAATSLTEPLLHIPGAQNRMTIYRWLLVFGGRSGLAHWALFRPATEAPDLSGDPVAQFMNAAPMRCCFGTSVRDSRRDRKNKARLGRPLQSSVGL